MRLRRATLCRGEMAPVEAGRADVIVVGAGPAGLAVGAVLRRAGLEPVLLERASCVGARWHTHYERLHLHTAKRHSALPYVPFPASYPTYPSRLQVIDYLEGYARQFALPIRFNQNVVSAERRDGLWEVATQDAAYQSRFLVVATGLNEQPHVPTWPGQDSFDGPMLHSADYRNGEPFRGQDVLVIGFGNSGGEIAIDLWEHGARPGLAVRSAVNVIFRDLLGIPVQQLSIALSGLPPRISDALTAPVRYLVYGDIGRYGLRKLPYGPVTQIRDDAQIPVIDVGVIRLIRAGRVRVYPGVREFTREGVTFTDGTTKPFGAVILATGYRAQAGAMFKEASRLTNGEGYPLVSGQEAALAGLYFCGFHNAATGLLREIGLEAERIGKAIAQQRRSSS